jgi:hypothetical protein
MPIIYIKKSPGSGIGVFDNLVGYQLVQGGGLTYGNFQFTPSITEKTSPSFYTNLFDKPINLLDLGISDISNVRESIANELNVVPNYDISQVFNFSLYGSLSKRFSVSITKIINYFPASIDVNLYNDNLVTGYTATNISYELDSTTFDIDVLKIKNPFGVDFTKNAAINITSNEISVSKFRDLTTYYKDYVLDIEGKQYPIIILNPTDSLTSGVLNITVSGDPFNILIFQVAQSTTPFVIRPSNFLYNLVLKSDFDEVEQYMLNTLTNPVYTMNLQVPEEKDDGSFVIVNYSLNWPLDGRWNLDISSESFDTYLNKLQEIAEYFDGVKTNLISRFFVADSLKEFDTNDRRVESILQIYGRSFDEVKKFIDSLGYMNSINYVPKNDIPSQLLSDLSKTLGWGDNFDFLYDKSLIDSIFGTNESGVYSAYSRTQTPLELNYAFYRNLVINSFYLFKSKGTRRPIEFLMKLFGIPDAMIQFNEHVYLADGPIDLNKFNNAIEKLDGGFYIDSDPIFTNQTYTIEGILFTGFTSNNDSVVVNYNINDYPVDTATGYPKKVSNPDFYFQKGAGWYELTPSHRSLEIPKRVVSGDTVTYSSEFEGFTYGQKYLDLFRRFPYMDDGFGLTKTIDNKKSWNVLDVLTRKSLDGDYNAYYFLNTERLLLNVKNIDLYINPSQAISYDIWLKSVENNYPIPQEGLNLSNAGSPNDPSGDSKDSTKIIPSPKTKTFFEFLQTFSSNMINVRNRLYITDGKTGGYPVLQYIFWKYLEAQQISGATNKYTYNNLIEYVNNINPYWVKIVEQMIPATTIWNTGGRYENTPFHRQKYVYKRRLGCVVGEIPNKKVLNQYTEINIWYTSYGDMDDTYQSIIDLKNTTLKECFLKYYNNDLSLYEKNVKLRDFSSPTIRGRTFNVLDTLGSSNEIKSVINLVFQDESSLYVGNDFNINNEPNAVYTNDIIELRTKVASLSKSYYTSIIFRIDTKTKKSTDFKNLLIAVRDGSGKYNGVMGLSDKSQFSYLLDVEEKGTPIYYSNLIVSALNDIGFNLPKCDQSKNVVNNFKGLNLALPKEDIINSDIFNGICQKNLTEIISIPNEKFVDILRTNIMNAKETALGTCDDNKVLTTWFLEFKLGDNTLIRSSFYSGLGNTDAPTEAIWNSALTNILPELISNNINYQVPTNNQVTLTDLFCKTINTDNKKMTLNISVDVTLICE